MNYISNCLPNQVSLPDFSQINLPSKEAMSLLGGKLYHVVVTTASEQNPAVMGISLVVSTVLAFIGRQKNPKIQKTNWLSFSINLITLAIAGSVTMTSAGLITSVAYAALFTLAGKICAFFLDKAQQFCCNKAREIDSENTVSLLNLNNDALTHVFSFLDNSSTLQVMHTCKPFNQLFSGVILRNQFAINWGFGPQDWERYFGDVGEVPPLPTNIGKILESQCPFWPDKKVKETHMLVLIPKTVNGKPFTLNLLQELIKNPKEKTATYFSYYSQAVQQELGNTEVAESYWVLMTKDVIPNSRSKTYEEQKQLVEQKKAEGYKLPSALEAATSISLHYFKTNERTYGRGPLTYTRCRETVGERQWPVAIGGFVRGGLDVRSFSTFVCDVDGVAGVRKF